jgi:hypothetical protein
MLEQLGWDYTNYFLNKKNMGIVKYKKIYNYNEIGGGYLKSSLIGILEELPKNSTEISPDGILKPVFNGVSWDESASENEIIENSINREFELYETRKEQGIIRYLKIAAEFRVKKVNGEISEDLHKVLDKVLKPVRDEFVNGQFIGAKDALIEVGNGIIGQDLYDRLYSSIESAIQEFY